MSSNNLEGEIPSYWGHSTSLRSLCVNLLHPHSLDFSPVFYFMIVLIRFLGVQIGGSTDLVSNAYIRLVPIVQDHSFQQPIWYDPVRAGPSTESYGIVRAETYAHYLIL